MVRDVAVCEVCKEFIVLLGPDHYWQKINLSTLIIQKEKLGRKSDHLTHLGINYYRSRDLILENVSCCVELVFVRKKRQLNSIINKAGCLSLYWIFKLKEGIGEIKKTRKCKLSSRSSKHVSYLRNTWRRWRNVQWYFKRRKVWERFENRQALLKHSTQNEVSHEGFL